ncbi:Fe3+/spermidine/putrescine ABC transporter ATP-binding protein [Sinorhizobium medicae]|uniref:Fe3+/spermidine/putrescine ABC transporter ATP-binding protein n=1 Tax=Sinorhizobium medicae TaxID=110321 RepID=A0ABX4TJX3_9HYPH|nr:ABC transporter ATP-binding protein [Sinorhizobium medicae]PLT88313.1 Fe3+/spermidine/putrescine ABC transporter ATP-binding protein [Sinorhizobium medicae]PLU02564.1 Fe3+/spermidine/putrescine ABC transporter ATP-binding protein [Sinorhizobium medicae]PLU13258.1 Fe3+/spermidine/putrescine ABC transporter ATP-binding protein [Sinorhizobium medicae]PLU19156.1 Fe3+/spermidine/putrescine ABC transporter ATP-binding protein [Sinorhizobium medicae]PLU33596.1 Fe3+/spermidine/putrescine ABC transp
MTKLTIHGLSKTYAGDVRAVRKVDLEVESGEFISLLGSSGCGKTTTLQMVAGFVSPTAGTVLVDGEDITHLAPEKRDMGIVFQSYALFPHMTVAQNVGFGLEMRKMKPPQIDERVAEALSMVRLFGLENRYPSEMSGGQRQRVAIARVLAIRPRVLLLDEPMSNLDAKLRGEMHVELRALQRRLGITTILVTHDQIEAMTMSDRIAVMANGVIAELGTPQQIYDHPTSELAFKFLGQANLIEGKISAVNQGIASVGVGGGSITAKIIGAQAGQEIRLYVRPERLRLCPTDQCTIKGKVATRLFLGGIWFYEIESDLGTIRVTVVNAGTTQPREGDVVGITWNEGDLQHVAPEHAHG